MDYAASVAWLESLPRYGGPKRDAARMHAFLSAFGDPHRSFRVVHVTGTNGKGSVAATLSSLLRAAGQRVGLYTSPHLARTNERMRVDGEEIPDADLARLATEARALVEKIHAEETPATFDVLTLVAFRWFAERGVETAVVEVGIGGRLDATNVFDDVSSFRRTSEPAASESREGGGTAPVVVLTNVGLDHVELLGPTRADVAREKLALAKFGCTLVTAETDEEVLAIVRRHANTVSARLVRVGRDVKTTVAASTLDGTRFNYAGERWRLDNLETPLLGAHQVTNAACALAAAEALAARGLVKLNERAIRAGLAQTTWPGRLEVVRREPLVILDGAHNPHGVDALVRALPPLLRGREPVTLVLGISDSKPYRDMIPQLAGLADRVVVTRARHHGLATKAVLEVLATIGMDAARVPTFERVADAVEHALANTPPSGVVLVAGGLFLAAEAREAVLAGKRAGST